MLDIRNTIQHRLVYPDFQPIISLRTRSIIGFESLIRGLSSTDNAHPLSPSVLLDEAAGAGVEIEFDRLCRDTAITRFASIFPGNSGPLLFLNLNTIIIDRGVVGSGYLLNSVIEANIPAERVVIEIIESKVNDMDALLRFIKRCRTDGFLIALDDFGEGESGFGRIAAIKPDIIKVDRCLTDNIHESFHKQEIFRTVCRLGSRIGTLVLAEGVETEADTLFCLEAGADLFQGFHFGRPERLSDSSTAAVYKIIETTANNFRCNFTRSMDRRKRYFSHIHELVSDMVESVRHCDQAEQTGMLTVLADSSPLIECLYLLDMNGRMMTPTVFRTPLSANPVVFGDMMTSSLFTPAKAGDELNLKEYFLHIYCGLTMYTSDPYISKASGKQCITVARKYTTSSKAERILCCDIRSPLETGDIPGQ
ncbi:MAG: EAL domain-containing protein [Spirochaetes bacterium]|nr:EAL domain-containing protein [Spirochaetota bacterium]